MNESVRWLVGKGKVDQATNILKNIAKRNDRQVEEEVYRSFEVNILFNKGPRRNWSLTTNFHEMGTYITRHRHGSYHYKN